MTHEIGISSNCECGNTIEEILNNIKAAGFKYVMISEKSGEFEKSLQIAKKLGLNIPYAHIFSQNSKTTYLWCTGSSNKETIDIAVNGIKTCAKYGVPVAVMHASCGDAVNRVRFNKQGLISMQEILKTAQECNVHVALENVDGLSAKLLCRLLNKIKSPYLGYCYDCGHNELYNPKTNFIKKYSDRCFAVHIHDNLMDWRTGYDWTRDLHLLPFDGKIDFTKVIKKIAQSLYDGVLMLELHKVETHGGMYYKDMSPREYLDEAYKRGVKLLEIAKKFEVQR